MTPAAQKKQDTGLDALSDALGVSFRALRYVMALLILLYALSGFYVVDQHERAFVLVFGKAGSGPGRIKGPGLHMTLPKPFANVVRVPTERTHTVETEAFAAPFMDPTRLLDSLQQRIMAPPGDPFGYTLTADANVLHTGWALRYRISDPEIYAFHYADLETALLNELEHAVVKVSARLGIDEALQSEIEQFRAGIEVEVRQRIDEAGMGVRLERVDVLSRGPPNEVAEAFSEVLSAENDRSRQIHEARGFAATVLNHARGEAARAVSQAETYRKGIVDEVSADADYFEKIRAKYDESPEVLARTLLQDALRRTLMNVENKYVVHANRNGRQEIRIIVGPEQVSPWDGKKENEAR